MTEPGQITVAEPTGPMIYRQINEVMRSLEAIGKDRRNAAQGFQFRGIDDIYNELHQHLAKHGVFTVPTVLSERTEERTTKSGGALLYRILRISYRFFAVDGSSIEATVIGEGMDSGDKSANKAMAVAHKYALLQVFAIPTVDAKDPDEETHAVTPKKLTTPTVREPALFLKNNEAQVKWLKARLTENGLSHEVFDLVIEEMDGQDVHTHLDPLISRLKKEGN